MEPGHADGVVAVVDRLALQLGAPAYLRFDNGPEFVARAVNDWCRFNSAASLFIDPGSPWQNAWIESFNGRLRDQPTEPFKLLDQHPATSSLAHRCHHNLRIVSVLRRSLESA